MARGQKHATAEDGRISYTSVWGAVRAFPGKLKKTVKMEQVREMLK